VGDAGLEVVHEAGDCGGELLVEVLDDPLGQLPCDRAWLDQQLDRDLNDYFCYNEKPSSVSRG
jgi:hypothetical protein